MHVRVHVRMKTQIPACIHTYLSVSWAVPHTCRVEMAPTEMVASLHVLEELCSIFFTLCIISYIVTPGNLKSYYIQPGRTVGYKSNVKLPTL